IHIVHRFMEERRRGVQAALRITVMQVGVALLAAMATTIGVFGILSLSRMPALARFGALTSLVIALSFLAAMVVLPSILVVKYRKSRK
ncbi:MAG: MMPL family transporter, partial [Candidatus Hadarchaeales archaeon]